VLSLCHLCSRPLLGHPLLHPLGSVHHVGTRVRRLFTSCKFFHSKDGSSPHVWTLPGKVFESSLLKLVVMIKVIAKNDVSLNKGSVGQAS